MHPIQWLLIMMFFAASTAGASAADAEEVRRLAGQPPAVITTPDARYHVSARTFQGIPSLERSPGGRLWATWYAGPGGSEDTTNHVVVAISDDDGRTWREPFLIVDPGLPDPVRAFDSNLWVDPLGRLWVFWAQSGHHYDGRAGVWAIVTENPDADEPVWTAPRRLADGIMMNKPTVLSTGEWMLPVAVWRFRDSYAKMAPDVARGSHVYVSADQGDTWQHRGTALVPETQADEHMVVELQNGRLWMLVRTDYGIGQAFSEDGGRTWLDPGPSGIEHPVSRFFITRLDSGRLLLVKHHEINVSGNRSRLMAFLSEDDGQTWEGGLMLEERTCAYPDGVQARDGSIYIIYDRGRRSDGQILFARFTDQDVLAGEPVSDQARLAQLITEFEPDINRDGVPIRQDESAASFDVPAEQVAAFKPGARVFLDQDDTLHRGFTRLRSPRQLEGKQFMVASMEQGIDVICTRPGLALVITPLEGNDHSQSQALIEAGFEKTSIQRFMPFISSDPTGNLSSVYQKTFEQGERLKLGRWAILVW